MRKASKPGRATLNAQMLLDACPKTGCEQHGFHAQKMCLMNCVGLESTYIAKTAYHTCPRATWRRMLEGVLHSQPLGESCATKRRSMHEDKELVNANLRVPAHIIAGMEI